MDWQLVVSYFTVKSTDIFLQCIAWGKSTIEGKTGDAKTRIVDFPRGNSHISGGKF